MKGGMAILALRLAATRAGYSSVVGYRAAPTPRQIALADPARNRVSAEYYNIIDRVARGETP